MSYKKVLRLLASADVPTVLVGGLAMRILGHTRANRVMALAVRSLDVETIVALLYKHGYGVVTSAGPTRAHVLPTAIAASDWIEETTASAVTLVRPGPVAGLGDVPLVQIDTSTQLDLLFDLPVPVMRLRERANEVATDDITIWVAAPKDLLDLRQLRPKKSTDDLSDIAFLRKF